MTTLTPAVRTEGTMGERYSTIGHVVAHDNTVTVARWWKCEACGRTLGEIVAGRVVIKIADRWLSLPLIMGIDQVCPNPKCRHMNALDVS